MIHRTNFIVLGHCENVTCITTVCQVACMEEASGGAVGAAVTRVSVAKAAVARVSVTPYSCY